MDYSPLGSSVHGLLQGRTLECVAIPFSRGSSWPRDQTQVSCIGRQILYRLSHQGGIRVWFRKELSVRRWHFDEEENSYLVSKYLSMKYFLVTKGKIVTIHLRTCWKCKLLSWVWLFATPHGIFQARILEWVAFPFSRGSSQPRSNPGLLHCRQILYQLSHKGSPKILDWLTYPFSRGSSPPRNWTGSLALHADSLPTELPGKPIEKLVVTTLIKWLKLTSQWRDKTITLASW